MERSPLEALERMLLRHASERDLQPSAAFVEMRRDFKFESMVRGVGADDRPGDELFSHFAQLQDHCLHEQLRDENRRLRSRLQALEKLARSPSSNFNAPPYLSSGISPKPSPDDPFRTYREMRQPQQFPSPSAYPSPSRITLAPLPRDSPPHFPPAGVSSSWAPQSPSHMLPEPAQRRRHYCSVSSLLDMSPLLEREGEKNGGRTQEEYNGYRVQHRSGVKLPSAKLRNIHLAL